MKYHEIRNDHDQDPSDLAIIPHDQVKTGVQDERLTSHHAPPADTDQDSDRVGLRYDEEVCAQIVSTPVIPLKVCLPLPRKTNPRACMAHPQVETSILQKYRP